MTRDLVGLLWRPELAGAILGALDRIDVVEVIAEDWLDASRARQRALRTLGGNVPVLLHGVSLGLASAAPVAEARLDALARLCEIASPLAWSEHLAFVRGGGIELGHLAAPPRTQATIEGTARNVARATQVIGRPPSLENVATLIDPPGSTLDETSWIDQVLRATSADLLLDLHNLHANATSFGFDARMALARLPLDRVREVHIAGGSWVRASHPRILDDHHHDVPPAVYELLAIVAEQAPQPLTVILERDGAFPPFSLLLDQLEQARAALHRGRLRRANEHRL